MPKINPPIPTPTVAFIGFGEAAQAFTKGWSSTIVPTIRAYDRKTDARNTAATNDAQTRARKLIDYADAGVDGHLTVADTLTNSGANADVIFSMVTADQAKTAGLAVAAQITPDTLYFDCNSCAPDTKRAIADAIDSAGGRYVDVAIMAPVHPKLHRVPVLVSGPHTTAALAMMQRLDMAANPANPDKNGDIGDASSIKMVRSIMVKGLEALMAECLLAGRRAGVEDIVFDTLDTSYPGFDFRKRAAYGLDRMIEHGNRRAAEMREVALTVEHLGLDNPMSRAIVDWQQTIGDLDLTPQNATYTDGADAILAALSPKPEIQK
ncbi:MAG: DUF1932 domain-containing protein [Rhodobacterales bacterium]|nr:DUF1932 domain-containing protein [Rhodobacterales bacterium]